MNNKIDEYSGAFLLEVLKEFVLLHVEKKELKEEFWTNKLNQLQQQKEKELCIT